MKIINLKIILLFILLSFSFIAVASTSAQKPSENPSIKQATSQSNTASVWQAIARDFRLDHKTQSPQVKKEIRLLLAEKTKLQHILKAATPYIYFIHQSTKTNGLPAELALIPFIESEFNPNDVSSTGARGLWQLMHGTARILGVRMSAGYDGRRDIVASTKAALAHFKYLGGHFKGNWDFAMAAYNCGQGRIESAQRRYGTKPVWYYPLPRETRVYVARLLAISHILKNPKQYGIELPPVANQPYFAEVKMKNPASLNKIAQSTRIKLDTLRKLNPEYPSGRLQKKDGSYRVLVPVEQAANLKLIL